MTVAAATGTDPRTGCALLEGSCGQLRCNGHRPENWAGALLRSYCAGFGQAATYGRRPKDR
jgi:hypothetical protein